MRQAQQLATTRWSVHMVRGVLVMINTGVITMRSQEEDRQRAASAMNTFKPKALLVDLRRAVILLSAADWQRMAEPAFWETGRIDRPIAYLTDPAYEGSALDYCAAMATHGMQRAPFIDYETALAWCVWQAGGGLPAAPARGPSRR